MRRAMSLTSCGLVYTHKSYIKILLKVLRTIRTFNNYIRRVVSDHNNRHSGNSARRKDLLGPIPHI